MGYDTPLSPWSTFATLHSFPSHIHIDFQERTRSFLYRALWVYCEDSNMWVTHISNYPLPDLEILSFTARLHPVISKYFSTHQSPPFSMATSIASEPAMTASTGSCLTPEKKTELLAQVKQLSEDTLSIDVSFYEISRRLANLQEANIPEKFVRDIQRLGTTWDGLHSVWNIFLSVIYLETDLIHGQDLFRSSLAVSRRCRGCESFCWW